jgi:hypothetical protein
MKTRFLALFCAAMTLSSIARAGVQFEFFDGAIGIAPMRSPASAPTPASTIGSTAILFINLNNRDEELAAVRLAAKVLGQRVIVVPEGPAVRARALVMDQID